MNHYPKCKSCIMSRDCGIPRLVALERRRQDVDFESVDYRAAEMEIAMLLESIKRVDQHLVPFDALRERDELRTVRPEDS